MKRLLILSMTLAVFSCKNDDEPPNQAPPIPEGTVSICTQVWKVKNLSVVRYRNGDSIPEVTDPVQWANLTTGAWCYYNNDPNTEPVYGRLYNWFAVNDPRGLAPAGWHVPTNDEWNFLVQCLDPIADTASLFEQSTVAGGILKSTDSTLWNPPNTGATDARGWKGLPAGYRNHNGIFNGEGLWAYWWSSTEYDEDYAWFRKLSYNNSDYYRYDEDQHAGYSVRVIRD